MKKNIRISINVSGKLMVEKRYRKLNNKTYEKVLDLIDRLDIITEGRICLRCGYEEGTQYFPCESWGDSWKRHLYRKSNNYKQEFTTDIIDGQTDYYLLDKMHLIEKVTIDDNETTDFAIILRLDKVPKKHGNNNLKFLIDILTSKYREG